VVGALGDDVHDLAARSKKPFLADAYPAWKAGTSSGAVSDTLYLIAYQA
jgi:hypothetical protein